MAERLQPSRWSEIRQLAERALRLRGWVLGLLADEAEPAPVASGDGAWRVFLAVERCALPLHGMLARRPELVDPAAAALVADAASREMRRVLSARAQSVRLGRYAARHARPLMVLKGGVSAMGARPVDLADLDVLVQASDAEGWKEGTAVEFGYIPAGDDGRIDAPDFYHFSARRISGEIPLEIHTRIHGVDAAGWWESAIALEGVPGAVRPAPVDHVWHLLVHSIASHRERRGTLRDLLILADSVAECTPQDRELIGARLRGAHQERAMAHAMEFAVAVTESARAHDRFRATAALSYVMALALPRHRFPRSAALAVADAGYSLIEPSGVAARLRRLASYDAGLEAKQTWLGGVERRLPYAGRALRVSARMAKHLAALPLAILLARLARHAVEAPAATTRRISAR